VDECRGIGLERWRHTHLFTTLSDGKTRMIDAIQLRLPLAFLTTPLLGDVSIHVHVDYPFLTTPLLGP